jgi:drug/metabolite transporter (DMT)-like permease
VTFGSIVGYSAYIYSLETLPVSLVSIYTFINPVVAVALGKLFYDEPFGRREVVAMAVIFVGVGIVKIRGLRKG